VRAVIHIVDEPGNEEWPQRLKALAASDVQIMAISHQMAEEYGRRFGDPYPVIFRGTDSSPLTVDHGESSARVVRYLGAIHNPSYLDSNFHPLQDVAAAIERLAQQGTDIHLELMGGGLMTRDNVQNGAWPPSTRYTPYLPPHLEKQTVAEASLLVLPLTFDPQGAKQQAMSFSAKLPVYLSSGAPVLIYGPAENATVKFCLEQGVARVVSSPDPEQLLEAVRDLVANPAAQCAKARADWDRVKEELSAPRIRERFWGVLRDAGKAPFPTPAETP
jgi:glycosyltransferase involved in cell wall biosynthesis